MSLKRRRDLASADKAGDLTLVNVEAPFPSLQAPLIAGYASWCLDGRPVPSPLDAFIPRPDVRERFHAMIAAPAEVVMAEASHLDLQSLALVRGIFWLRQVVMGGHAASARPPQGLLADMEGMGWALLVDEPHSIVCGAACQPWLANAAFTPIPAERLADYAEPEQVKIAWSLEAETLGPTTTRFVHETRAVATDPAAQARFLRYWRWARVGIVTIRLLLMPAIRHAAERRWARELHFAE